MNTMRKAGITAAVAGFGLLGTIGASQAQINFDYSTTYAGTTSPTVYDGGNGGTLTVNPATDLGTLRDASGLGATIHLVTNTGGISEFATSTATSHVAASDVFDVTIFQQGGGSATFAVPLSINATFNAGTNNGGATSSTFTSDSFMIGLNSYTANILRLTDPGAPPIGGGSSPIPGDVSIHIMAMGPPTVPEPGSVAFIVGMGFSGMAFLSRRRASRK